MKRLILLILLLLPGLAFGQKRIYIETEFGHDTFIVNLGSYEKPELEVSFLLGCGMSDSLFLVIKEKDLYDASVYMQALEDTYLEWKAIAKKNKLTDYKRPVDLAFTVATLRWVEHPDSDLWFEYITHVTHETKRGEGFEPDFSVKRGFPKLFGSNKIYDKDNRQLYYNASYFLDEKDIRRIKGWCNADKIRRFYDKHKPKMTKEQMDRLFE